MRDEKRQRSARYASHTQSPSSPCREEFCSENAHQKKSVLMDGPQNCSGVQRGTGSARGLISIEMRPNDPNGSDPIYWIGAPQPP